MIEEAISWVYIKGRVCIWGRQNQSKTFFYAEAVCFERDVVREQVEYPKSIQWSKQQGCWDKKTGTQTGTRLIQLAKSFSHQIFFVASAITRPEWSFSSFCHTLTAYACTEESIYSGFKNDTCFLTFRLTQKSKLTLRRTCDISAPVLSDERSRIWTLRCRWLPHISRCSLVSCIIDSLL